MNIMKIVSFVVLACVSAFSFAGKIAVFNPQAAFTNTEAAKAAYEELKRNPTFAKMISDAEGINQELQALDKERKSKGLTWGADQAAENKKKIDYLLLDRRGLEQKIEAEQKAYFERMMVIRQQHAPGILEKIVKAEGIDLVLRPESAIYAAPELDITQKIIDELNKKVK